MRCSIVNFKGPKLTIPMSRWLLVSHCLVVSAFAASEAQLKFVTLPAEKRREVRESIGPLRSAPSASSHHVAVVPISNFSIARIARELPGSGAPRNIPKDFYSHDPGRLHTAASYHQARQDASVADNSNSRFNHELQSGFYHRDDHSRNYRGPTKPRADFDLHGSHYERPAYRHQTQGGNSYREGRAEVRVDDFRKDRSSQKFQTFLNRPEELHGAHRPQTPLENGDRTRTGVRGWQDQNYPEQQSGLHYRDQQHLDDDREDEDPRQRSDERQSCGEHSLCLEPNGLFPIDGNCCGFVNCANCRSYTQRCAAGTVFDLDLWICNHERDTRQCAGKNRECAHQILSLRGQSGEYSDHDANFSVGGHSADAGSSKYNSGWEYASASEEQAIKQRSGKVSRVRKASFTPKPK